MAPNPNVKNTILPGRATAERHLVSGAITLRWVTDPSNQPALILATTDPSEQLTSASAIGVAARSPFTWIPSDTSQEYFFTIIPQAGEVIDTVDWVSPAPDGPLEGRWYKACGAIHPDYEEIGYDAVDFFVSSAAYRIEAHFFSDPECSIQSNPPITYKGQIRLGASILTPEGEEVTKLNAYSNAYLYSDLPPHTIFRVQGDELRFGQVSGKVESLEDVSQEDRPVSLNSERIFIQKSEVQ